jgi:gag-polypeptide of LTR copia-type
LQTVKKGGSSCAQFLHQMQLLVDRLRSIGTDVSDNELVLYTTQDLGSEYESFVTVLSMRTTSPSMMEFSNLLLAHEARILTNLRSSTSTVHLTTQSVDFGVTGSENSIYYTHNIISQDQHTYRDCSYEPRGRGNN